MLSLIAYKIHEHIQTTAILVWDISIYQDTESEWHSWSISGTVEKLQNILCLEILDTWITDWNFKDSTWWHTPFRSAIQEQHGKPSPIDDLLVEKGFRRLFHCEKPSLRQMTMKVSEWSTVPFYVEASLTNNIIEYYHLAWRFKNSLGKFSKHNHDSLL